MARKPTKRKTKAKTSKTAVATPVDTNKTISIRKISNGWIVNTSWSTKMKYHSVDKFSSTKPVIKIN